MVSTGFVRVAMQIKTIVADVKFSAKATFRFLPFYPNNLMEVYTCNKLLVVRQAKNTHLPINDGANID